MSVKNENNWLAILGAITAIVTIAVQLISLGEMKGQFTTMQETLKNDITAIKMEIHLLKTDTAASSNRLADLNARVVNIERKL
jgi:hypothetical protein